MALGDRSVGEQTAGRRFIAGSVDYNLPGTCFAEAVDSGPNAIPLPSNDVWITAHAMETGAYLVSSDRESEPTNLKIISGHGDGLGTREEGLLRLDIRALSASQLFGISAC